MKVCYTCRFIFKAPEGRYMCINSHGPKLYDYVRLRDTCPKWDPDKKEDEQ